MVKRASTLLANIASSDGDPLMVEGSLNTDLIERVTMTSKNINRLRRNIPLPVYMSWFVLARTAPIVPVVARARLTEKLRKQMQPSLSDHQHGGIDISGNYLK